MTNIAVLIPALNEQDTIAQVIQALPKQYVTQVVVIDNGSTDNTVLNANAAGATTIVESRRGYGAACLCGIDYLKKMPTDKQPQIVVFIDADLSDNPAELPLLIQPILDQNYDIVIGSRILGKCQKGAMTLPQQVGNRLTAFLLRALYKVKMTDLGPFRAIKWQALCRLKMQDSNYGWTVEMQAKAARYQLACTEIPVTYRRRAAGKSKISGTIYGTIAAGYKILFTVAKVYFDQNKIE